MFELGSGERRTVALACIRVYYIQTTIMAVIRNVEARDMGMGFVALIQPQYLRIIYNAVQEGIFCETHIVEAGLCY